MQVILFSQTLWEGKPNLCSLKTTNMEEWLCGKDRQDVALLLEGPFWLIEHLHILEKKSHFESV